MIIHCSFTMLILLIPHTVVTVIIHKVINTFTVLLVLKPLTFVFFSIRDVYKRQPVTSEESDHTDKTPYQTEVRGKVAPVSYTHLDVYKRQAKFIELLNISIYSFLVTR